MLLYEYFHIFALNFKPGHFELIAVDYIKWTDNALVEEYLLTQHMAYFDELYKRYSNKVYFKCYSLLGDYSQAEDATQEIFLKVVLSLAGFNKKSKFSTWLYSITYNFCIDELRRLKKNKMVFVEESDMQGEPTEDEEDNLTNEANLVALQATLDVIDEADRAILIMKYQDKMMVKDIADILSLSESAVKMRLKRAKEKFKKIFLDILRQ